MATLVIDDVDVLSETSCKINKLNQLKKRFIVAGALLFVAGAVIAIVLAVVITQHAKNTPTLSTGGSSTIIISNSTTSISSTTIFSTHTSTSTSTNRSSTRTACPINNCTFSTWYTLTSLGYYGVEHVDINCTQALSNLTAFIYVQRTVNATYAAQYHTFWDGTVIQTYYNTSSQIVYSWSIISGQTISLNGYPYFIEAQFQLQGINQTVSHDTYLIITQSTCNEQMLTYSGHF